MCIRYRQAHPGCGHVVRVTAGPEDRWERCIAALPDWLVCPLGPMRQHDTEYVDRDYCDTCIIKSIMLLKAKGVTDLGACASSMGVSINDLMREDPCWQP